MVRIMVIPALVVVGICAGYLLIIEKLSTGYTSTMVRIDDILACGKCFLKNPLYGTGYQNIESLNPYRLVLRANAGLSSGLGGIFAFGGIMWGFWYVCPIVVSIFQICKKRRINLYYLFNILMGCLLLVTVVQNKVISVMFCALSWIVILESGWEK
jgi:hypothetical protein